MPSVPVVVAGARAEAPDQYDAFTRSATFSDFATTSNGAVGLEQIHNAIHWDGACGGQFLSPQYTAFDPLLCGVSPLFFFPSRRRG